MLQQTPLTQELFVHSTPVWQVPPFAFLAAQVLPEQKRSVVLQVPPAPPQHAWPRAPQGFTPVAVTVNITDAPDTATVTVALRVPVADGLKDIERVHAPPPMGIAAVQPPVMVSSAVLLLVIVGTLVATSPPLMIITDVVALVWTVTLPRLTLAGLAVRVADRMPVPVRARAAGLPPVVALTDKLADCMPRPAGAKWTRRLQVAPPARTALAAQSAAAPLIKLNPGPEGLLNAICNPLEDCWPVLVTTKV